MPIIHDVPQRSEMWDRLRLGVPTASNFHKIITPLGKTSVQYKEYCYHLIAERLLGRKVDTYTSPAMERGTIVEDEAIAWYELTQDMDTSPVGFIASNDGRIGCSPDRLVGDEGLLEIKAPLPATQVGYLITGKLDQRYTPQIQGQLYISERQWVDIVAWHEELPRTIIRVERDEEYIKKLAKALAEVNAEIDRVMGMIDSVSKRPKQTLREALDASISV